MYNVSVPWISPIYVSGGPPKSINTGLIPICPAVVGIIAFSPPVNDEFDAGVTVGTKETMAALMRVWKENTTTRYKKCIVTFCALEVELGDCASYSRYRQSGLYK